MMGFKAIAETDIPCEPLAGVTTVQLAKMLHRIYQLDIAGWDDLSPATHKIFYGMAAQLIRDWPKA